MQRWKPLPPCIQTSNNNNNNDYQYGMVYVCMYFDHHYNPIWTKPCTAMETTTTISTASFHQLQGSESPTGRRSSAAGLTERSLRISRLLDASLVAVVLAFVFVFVYLTFVYICIYIYIFRERERERERKPCPCICTL